MSERVKANLIKYGCSAAFVALFAGGYIVSRDFAAAELVDKFRYLADAFTIPGLLLIMAGCLVWAESEGALDGISYAARMAFKSLIPAGRAGADEKYGDYVARKRANKVKGYSFLFIAGAVSMVVAVIFMVLFYSLYK